ncbi:MAG: head-tail connector protein [Rickettsiales bacterium]|jgi:hypothetical protein|nr:head-tail connector protein [Rickettsiales bacterium]
MENKTDASQLENIYKRYLRAMERRAPWESHWEECYAYALPQKSGTLSGAHAGGAKKNANIFDSTAEAAVDNLASSLLSQLTPPWSKWFGLAIGADIAEAGDKAGKYAELESFEKILQSHFDRSNFYVEAHQCYLDLITVGTAVMLFEETPVGESSAFKFAAIPMSEVALEDGPLGRIDTVFRRTAMTLEHLRLKFGAQVFSDRQVGLMVKNPDAKVAVIESVAPRIVGGGQQGCAYVAFADDADGLLGAPGKVFLKSGAFQNSPFICFRWLKVPSEIYGRSPVMKALPDIKTANKVVELILKNASISVTGIWQADDDGVLNLDNINLAPGMIIPKAVGSSGLTPLRTGADFDVSQLVLSDLRAKINRCLLIDQLSPAGSARMTATEVIERGQQVSRILGATYGRLQSEFLTPVIMRAIGILKRRGEISDIMVNGREIDLKYQSPLASSQAVRDAENVIGWIRSISVLGEEALGIIDKRAVARFLGRTFGVSERLIAGDE